MSSRTITPSSSRFACAGFHPTPAKSPRSKPRWATRTSAPTHCSTAIICSSNKPRRNSLPRPSRRHVREDSELGDWHLTCRRRPSMPFINGRFYINPTFGRAVEFARANEAEQEGAEHQEHRPAHHRRHGGHGDNYDAATTPEGVANQIYNETSGLRTTDRSGNGPGSDWNLQQARFAMAHVIQNRAASGIRGGLASDEIN